MLGGGEEQVNTLGISLVFPQVTIVGSRSLCSRLFFNNF